MKFSYILKFTIYILCMCCFTWLFPGRTEARVVQDVDGNPCWQGNSNYPFWSMGSGGGSFVDLESAGVIYIDNEGMTIQFKSYSCMYSENISELDALPWSYHGIYIRALKVNGNTTFATYIDGSKEDENFWNCSYGHAIAKMIHNALKKMAENKQVEAGYFPSENFPTMYVIHHAIDGEASTNLMQSQVIPKHTMTLMTYPILGSPLVGNIGAEEPVRIIDYELHTYPRRYLYNYRGKLYGFLSYHGEGVYSVLGENGQIEYVKTGRNNIYTHADLWLCVRNADGVEGWLPFENTDDWELSRGYGIFHPI
ncbi:hypothetical protein LQE88_09940 [Acidaminococcus sp. NSJ-142]|jgi:hypothetical protein|uniref:hypothetical protein n=1 Tax=Acidaminococcus hominis TaxID=2897706 RepID=UPI001E2FEE04|nr:hypothetical protein [Acidaminococcus hominis]MCD2436298.1 hypothetical protein [Acidaminococcus hominis]